MCAYIYVGKEKVSAVKKKQIKLRKEGGRECYRNCSCIYLTSLILYIILGKEKSTWY